MAGREPGKDEQPGKKPGKKLGKPPGGAPGRRRAPRSLAFSLFVSSALWSTVALAIAGVVLVALYRASVERSFDTRLDIYLKALVAGIVPGQDPDAHLQDPGNLGDPRFGLPLSGWYWLVRDAEGRTVMASPSLAGERLGIAAETQGQPRTQFVEKGAVRGPDGEALRYLERRITLADGRRFSLAVAGDAGEIERDVALFGTRVAITLAIFGVGLVLATLVQVRIGLGPLKRMQAAIKAIRGGDAERVEGDFPREMAPVAEELNALIESNRDVVERAHTHAGNLAHALKTPLSVILNEARAAGGPFGDKVAEQAVLMGARISADLDRARAEAQRRVSADRCEAGPAAEALARVMRRVHDERNLDIAVACPAGLTVRMQRQDLDEMLGNLMDNACKWARGRVEVRGVAVADGGRRWVVMTVDDDGPGLPADRRAEALQRGRRLDESVPGSGLGLSIVTDLATSYGGRLRLDAAPAGGLRAELRLPAG